MNSYLLFVCPLRTSDEDIKEFYQHPFDAFMSCNLEDQFRFLYGQAISLNYLKRVYNHDLPYFISLLSDTLREDYIPYTAKLIASSRFDEAEKYTWNQRLEIVKWLFSFNPDQSFMTKFDIKDIIYFLKDTGNSKVPVPCTAVFYESYLLFLQEVFNRAYGLTLANKFHISGLVALPQFTINNSMLIEHDIVVSETYNYSYEDNQIFGTNPLSLGNTSIFAFWRGYNWKYLSYDSVVSILATYGALEVPCTSDNSLKRAYYDVYQLMNPMSTSASIRLCYFHDTILNFLVDIFTRFNTKSVDSVMMNKLFWSNNDDADINNLQTRMQILFKDVAEANEALRSTLRNLGIGKMSSGSLPMFVEDANLVSRLLDAGSVKKEEDQEDQKEFPDQDKKKDSKKKNDPESPDEKQEDATTEPEEGTEDATPADAPDDKPDQKEDEPKQDEDTSLDQKDDKTVEEEPASVDPNEKEDATNDEDNGAGTNIGESTSTKVSSHTPPPKPRIPGMSLKSGIQIELANDDETIDSFLYRKEVGSFIDDIVSNPNHDFSVQQIEAFKIVKARLLWILNVQSLYNLLKAISKA